MLPELFKKRPEGFDSNPLEKEASLRFDDIRNLSPSEIDDMIRANSKKSEICPACGDTFHITTILMFGTLQTMRTSCKCKAELRLKEVPFERVLSVSDLGKREIEDFLWEKWVPSEANKDVHAFFVSLLVAPRVPSLWVYGGPKSGKSHLVVGFLMEYAKRHKLYFQYLNARLFQSYIPDLKDKESWALTLEKVTNIPVLIIDHLGETPLSPWLMAKMTEILQMRYDNNRQTIYISRDALDATVPGKEFPLLPEKIGVSAASIINSDLRESKCDRKWVRLVTAHEAYQKGK